MLNDNLQPGPPLPAGEWDAPDRRLTEEEAAQVDHDAAINAADTAEKLRAAFGAAYKSTADAGQRDKYKAAYDARMKQITNEGAAQ